MPLVAALRLPPGDAWVEVAGPRGGFGLLGFTGPGGSVHVRRVERRNGAGQGWWRPPVSLYRSPVDKPPQVDWAAVARPPWPEDPVADRRWGTWARAHLGAEVLDEGIGDDLALTAKVALGLLDLVVLALALSPLSLVGLAELCRATDLPSAWLH